VHNNANVLVLGGRITPPDQAFMIIEAWLSSAFAGGRHLRRLQQIDSLE
jgi:ribose 5-phosphate isomerase B